MSQSLFSHNSTAQKNPSIQPKLSVVVPIYNEAESISQLIDTIANTLQKSNLSYEIICVDDGSQDGSTKKLHQLAQSRTDLKAVILRRNYGQTLAMAAVFK